MKVGILTHPLETNYGGLLQAFALQKVIKMMGHDVYTIDRHNIGSKSPFPRHLLGYFKRCYKRFIKRDATISTSWDARVPLSTKEVLGQNMRPFVERNIRLTEKIWSTQLKQIDEKYQFDAYVVGSDQVWLPSYCLDSFLSFVSRRDVIKISYAASCSCGEWSTELGLKCKELAKSFKGLSVRESDLVSFCRKRLDKDALLVLDPTLLLSPNDYLDAVKALDMERNSIVFAYILDYTESKQKVVDKVGKILDCPVVWVNPKKKYVKRSDINIEECIFPSVDYWINCLNRASFVVTDSYHGTVFSILFNKPFFAIANEFRGISRFKSLLNIFDLESRLVFDEENGINLVHEPINFEDVNRLLLKNRELSLNYLHSMLG